VRSRDLRLARWGALYALAPVLSGIGAAIGSTAAIQAGVLILFVEAVHAACRRGRLATAILDGQRTSGA
jgi:hypothetical protein